MNQQDRKKPNVQAGVSPVSYGSTTPQEEHWLRVTGLRCCMASTDRNDPAARQSIQRLMALPGWDDKASPQYRLVLNGDTTDPDERAKCDECGVGYGFALYGCDPEEHKKWVQFRLARANSSFAFQVPEGAERDKEWEDAEAKKGNVIHITE